MDQEKVNKTVHRTTCVKTESVSKKVVAFGVRVCLATPGSCVMPVWAITAERTVPQPPAMVGDSVWMKHSPSPVSVTLATLGKPVSQVGGTG